MTVAELDEARRRARRREHLQRVTGMLAAANDRSKREDPVLVMVVTVSRDPSVAPTVSWVHDEADAGHFGDAQAALAAVNGAHRVMADPVAAVRLRHSIRHPGDAVTS